MSEYSGNYVVPWRLLHRQSIAAEPQSGSVTSQPAGDDGDDDGDVHHNGREDTSQVLQLMFYSVRYGLS